MAQTDFVVFDQSVKWTFFELVDILYQKEYFGFLDDVKKYVSEIEQYFKTEIPNLHRLGLNKEVTSYFEKYRESLFVATYRRKKNRTTWYAFYEVFDERYFKVVHIANNHTEDVAYI